MCLQLHDPCATHMAPAEGVRGPGTPSGETTVSICFLIGGRAGLDCNISNSQYSFSLSSPDETASAIGTPAPQLYFFMRNLTGITEQLSTVTFALPCQKSFHLNSPSFFCSNARCHRRISQQGSQKTLLFAHWSHCPGWCLNLCLRYLMNPLLEGSEDR